MVGFPNGASETPQEFDEEIVNAAADPLFVIHKPKEANIPDPQLSKAIQTCFDMKAHDKARR